MLERSHESTSDSAITGDDLRQMASAQPVTDTTTAAPSGSTCGTVTGPWSVLDGLFTRNLTTWAGTARLLCLLIVLAALAAVVLLAAVLLGVDITVGPVHLGRE